MVRLIYVMVLGCFVLTLAFPGINPARAEVSEGQGLPISDSSKILVPVGGDTGVYIYVPLNFSCTSGSIVYASAPSREAARRAFAPAGKPGPLLTYLWGGNFVYINGSAPRYCAKWGQLNLHVYFDEMSFIEFRVSRKSDKETFRDWSIAELGDGNGTQYLHHVLSGTTMPQAVADAFGAIYSNKGGNPQQLVAKISDSDFVWMRQIYSFAGHVSGSDASAVAKSASAWPLALRMAYFSAQPASKAEARAASTTDAMVLFAKLMALIESKSDGSAALSALAELARNGDARANHLIAIALKMGLISPEEAQGNELLYLSRAANLGRIEAAVDLALLHVDGSGGAPRDLPLAVTMLRSMVTYGRGNDASGRAHLALAELLANGAIPFWGSGDNDDSVLELYQRSRDMASDPVIKDAAEKGFARFKTAIETRRQRSEAMLVGVIITGIALLALAPGAHGASSVQASYAPNPCSAWSLARKLHPEKYEAPLALFGCARQ